MSYDTWPRWMGLGETKSARQVPVVPVRDLKPGVTLQYVEKLRRHVWQESAFIKRSGPSDWDPEAGAYPADRQGTCRHKCEWLRQRVGGVVLYGRRNGERHAVLWFKHGPHTFIAERDGIWPAQSAPFVADATAKAYST